MVPGTSSPRTAVAHVRLIPESYAPFAQRIFAAFAQAQLVTQASDVAAATWIAANDASSKLHFPAGPDAVALANAA
jgi:hypothetical protein